MTATVDVLAVVLFVFFVVGVGVGVLIVVALSARRADKASRVSYRRVTPPASSGYFDDNEPSTEPGDGSGNEAGDEPPWWQSRDDDARR